jgi:hypothetical protein
MKSLVRFAKMAFYATLDCKKATSLPDVLCEALAK